jgi:ABC-type cobalt transport system substrate-binding protein
MKKTILLLVLLLILVPVASAQQSKISTKDTEDYRDISVTPEGFQVKDPYAQPIYEPRATSLLPFHEKISALLNSYLAKLLLNFDVKEASALRILFQDIEPIFALMGDLLSLPITCIALPLLSLVRLIKAPFDILEFLITAVLEPILSIPAHEMALLRSFKGSLKNVLSFPLKALKPIEFLIYTPDPLRSLPDSLSLTNSFSALYSSSLQPLISLLSKAMDYIPFLNVINAFINTYILPMLKAPLKLFSFLSPYANDPHVSSLINMISLPFSLPMIALQQLLSLTKDLSSVILLPVLFIMRIPLTPLLILFNFVKHSLEGWKEFVNFTSFLTFIPTLILVVPVILFALLAFVVSIPLSILLAPVLSITLLLASPLLILLGSTMIFLVLGLLIGVILSLLLPAIIIFVSFLFIMLFTAVIYAVVAIFGAVVLGASAVGLIGLVIGGAAGLVLGTLAGGVFGGVAGLIAGAIIGIVIAGAIGLLIWAIPSIVLIPTGTGALAAVVLGAVIALIMLAAGAIIGLLAGGVIGLVLGALVGLILGIIAGALLGLIAGIAAGGILGLLGGLVIAALLVIAGVVVGLITGAVFGSAGLLIGLFVGPFIALFIAPLTAIILSWIGFFAGIVLSLLSIPLLILLSPILLPLLTLLSVPVLMIAITAIGAMGGAVLWSSILTAIAGLVSSVLASITAALQTIIPISIPLASVATIALLLVLGALALLSILSPTLFRALIPPEITSMLARAALLPAGITRIINGLAHLPADIMRAIAVLDAPAMAAMTVDGGGGGSGNVETALPAEFLVYNDTNIEDLSSEDMDLAKDLISSGFESGEYAVESLQKIPSDAKGVLVVWVSENSAYIQTGVTALEAIEIISRLSDSNPENDPDAGDYLELAGSATEAAESAAKTLEQFWGEGSPTYSKVLGAAGTAFTVGKVSYEGYQAIQDYDAGKISADELGEALTGSIVEGTIGVVSYFFPPAGLVYYGADAISRATTGEELDHWIYVGEKEWTTYMITEVIPAVKEFGYTTGDIWIAQAEAEAEASEALVEGIQDIASKVALSYTEFFLRILSIFSMSLLLMLSPSTEVDV